jgi:hypothetical protein
MNHFGVFLHPFPWSINHNLSQLLLVFIQLFGDLILHPPKVPQSRLGDNRSGRHRLAKTPAQISRPNRQRALTDQLTRRIRENINHNCRRSSSSQPKKTLFHQTLRQGGLPIRLSLSRSQSQSPLLPRQINRIRRPRNRVNPLPTIGIIVPMKPKNHKFTFRTLRELNVKASM